MALLGLPSNQKPGLTKICEAYLPTATAQIQKVPYSTIESGRFNITNPECWLRNESRDRVHLVNWGIRACIHYRVIGMYIYIYIYIVLNTFRHLGTRHYLMPARGVPLYVTCINVKCGIHDTVYANYICLCVVHIMPYVKSMHYMLHLCICYMKYAHFYTIYMLYVKSMRFMRNLCVFCEF